MASSSVTSDTTSCSVIQITGSGMSRPSSDGSSTTSFDSRPTPEISTSKSVAGYEPHRRIAREAHTGRRTGHDDVAGQQRR
jgi:hypothetical protein